MTQKSKETEKQTNIQQQSFLSSIGSLLFIIILVFGFKSSILDANNIPSGSMIPTLKIGDFLFVNKMRYSFRMPFTEKELYRFDDPKRGDIVTFAPPNRDKVRALLIALNLSPDLSVYIPPAIEENYIESNGPQRFFGLANMFSKRFVKRVIGLPGDTIRLTQTQVKTTRGDAVSYTFIEYKEKGSTDFKNYGPQIQPSEKELSDLDNVNAIGKSLFTENKRDFKHFTIEGSHMGNYTFYEYCSRNGGVCTIPDGYYMVMGDNRDDSSDSRFWGLVKREDILGKALIIYFSINWKDYTCMYKEGAGTESDPYHEEKYENEELFKHCHVSEIDRTMMNESIFGWLDRTLRYRIWRMDIRWKRIGRILQ
ncbi:MAG TPA: signal peptidase I [Leptospiraceae bacterium]|nr:signal peptidase I [Leptospiraceae bacterium]HMW04911.1 signal peptidase I [Leptospiraceae bacterium]HMX33960.1 signal peptidase I [Leptospiraceae bacterium]HMY30868.1 signal peptidase I [Leptospiraceae bacterium]HMZ62672.1 signal peptidase I [Leptospiraceae bacterium]